MLKVQPWAVFRDDSIRSTIGKNIYINIKKNIYINIIFIIYLYYIKILYNTVYIIGQSNPSILTQLAIDRLPLFVKISKGKRVHFLYPYLI